MIHKGYSGISGWMWALMAMLLWTDGGRAASLLTPFMPRSEDFTLLWWANGPQDYHGMKGPPPEPVLCMQSGVLGLVIDTQRLRLLHLGSLRKPMDMPTALRPENGELFSLPPAALELSVRHEGRHFTCIGRGALPKDAFYFPVRFIESGRFLQRVAIEGLEFADAAGKLLEAKGMLEIALWPDRAVLVFTLGPLKGTVDELEIAVAGRSASSAPESRQPVIFELFGPKNKKRPGIDASPALQVAYDQETSCTTVKLPPVEWKRDKDAQYPRAELDRLDRWRFTLSNPSDQEAVAPMMFVDERPPSVTGFTPMLCDADGTPTGIPVQISKNWHQRKEKGDLPHQGPWFHGCTFVRLPPRSRREFSLAMTYARYGGVPGASHSQLCLIGWGHNQFWDEAAIGSFGESICYEPGRVQRRCFIDDVRPLMTLLEPDAKPYGWAGNSGGGDFLMWVDESGAYRGFRGTRSDYRAYGPCLTEVCYVEETTGGEIGSRIHASIARSDDYLRAFYQIRYEVRKPVAWKHLAFFQLGADFYNDTPSRRVAIGHGNELGEEWEPRKKKDGVYSRPLASVGDVPWISMHDVDRAAMNKGGAIASRGLIVRSWKAVLGGKACPQPHVSFYETEPRKGNFRTVAELSPPPGITTLKPGDFVEAELELVVFPADAGAYYGPNQGFRKALEKDADTWRLVQREAAGNSLRVTPEKGRVERNYPLALAVDRKQQAACSLAGGVGYVPVTFTGLNDYRGYELLVDGQPLDQAVHGNDFWQTDYEPARRQWSVTYNLMRDGRPASRLELRKLSGRTSNRVP